MRRLGIVVVLGLLAARVAAAPSHAPAAAPQPGASPLADEYRPWRGSDPERVSFQPREGRHSTAQGGALGEAQWLSSRAALRVAAAEPESTPARFTTVDIIVDAGADSLAAYQIEITASNDAKIVGVEGGDHAAFHAPPHYDPAALQGGRIILAAFSTRTDLPSGRIRVAVLHMREVAPGSVTYHARLLAAARGDGSRFAPAVSAVPGGEQ